MRGDVGGGVTARWFYKKLVVWQITLRYAFSYNSRTITIITCPLSCASSHASQWGRLARSLGRSCAHRQVSRSCLVSLHSWDLDGFELVPQPSSDGNTGSADHLGCSLYALELSWRVKAPRQDLESPYKRKARSFICGNCL